MFDQLLTIAADAANLIRVRGQTVAVIDGATGGLISAALVSVPGASEFYVGGLIVYSLKGREVLLDLSPEELKGMRSVTESYALLQARAIRDRFGADWGIAESGSAGPGAHPLGVAAGFSATAVVGPGVSSATTIDTGSSDRIRNMHAFALAAISLFKDALDPDQ